MKSKYKRGDILVYNSRYSDIYYYYVKHIASGEYKLGILNQFSNSTYPIHMIDNNKDISLSLKAKLKQL